MSEYKARFLVADTPTAAGNIYRRAALEEAIKKLDGKPLVLTTKNSEYGEIDLSAVGGIISNITIDNDGNVVGKVTTLKTPSGQLLNADALEESGLHLSMQCTCHMQTDNGVNVLSDITFISVGITDQPGVETIFYKG